MNKKYLTLAGRIENEIEELIKIKIRITTGWGKYINSNDDLYLDSVALNFHDYYSSLERIFQIIANELDNSIPEGNSWHKDLLKQMTIKIKNVRPALLSKDIESKLDEYRGFRQIVRNVYSYNFSSEKIHLLVDNLDDINHRLINEMKIFINFLEQAGES